MGLCQPFSATCGLACSERHIPAAQGSGGNGALEHMLATQVMTTGAELQLSGVQMESTVELLMELKITGGSSAAVAAQVAARHSRDSASAIPFTGLAVS